MAALRIGTNDQNPITLTSQKGYPPMSVAAAAYTKCGSNARKTRVLLEAIENAIHTIEESQLDRLLEAIENNNVQCVFLGNDWLNLLKDDILPNICRHNPPEEMQAMLRLAALTQFELIHDPQGLLNNLPIDLIPTQNGESE